MPRNLSEPVNAHHLKGCKAQPVAGAVLSVPHRVWLSQEIQPLHHPMELPAGEGDVGQGNLKHLALAG